MHYVGLDIGGTTIKAGLIDETGRVLESRKTPTAADDLDAFVSKLAELIRGFQKVAAIDAAGIGVPGLHSAKTHSVVTSPNIPCLQNVNLEERLSDQVHIRVVTENDANAGAYAELVCGAAVGVRHMAYLTLGTGLGSGLVLNGSLYTGTSGYGGEFGHTVLVPGGRLCGCGRRGCVETLISATGMVRTAKEKGMTDAGDEPLTAEMIFQAALQGHAVAREIFEETGRYLGLACANLINLLNLELIVISGGVMASGDMLIRAAQEVAARESFAPSYADCRIVHSRLWPDGGIIGAAMLARDR